MRGANDADIDQDDGDESLVLVEPATAADIRRIAEIDRLAFPVDPWGEAEFSRELSRSHARLEIVRLAPRAPAAAYVSYWIVPGEIQLLRVATHPDKLRRGLARLLVLGLIGSATQLHLDRVTLEVRRSNATAIGLYRAIGFEVVGQRPRYYRDGEDALLMNLSLRQPA